MLSGVVSLIQMISVSLQLKQVIELLLINENSRLILILILLVLCVCLNSIMKEKISLQTEFITSTEDTIFTFQQGMNFRY